jgi:predicted nucleic acid-binding protein
VNGGLAVLDASPLIAFQQVDHLELLRGVFDRAFVPPEVAREAAPSLGALPSWIEVRRAAAAPPLSRMLGPGERAAIALAFELSADFIALDDLSARVAATEFDLTVIGSLGLLVRAKERGLISEVRPLMEGMISHGLYASDELRRLILSVAGESG